MKKALSPLWALLLCLLAIVPAMATNAPDADAPLLWDIPYDVDVDTFTALALQNAGVPVLPQAFGSTSGTLDLVISSGQSVTQFGQPVRFGDFQFFDDGATQRFYSGLLVFDSSAASTSEDHIALLADAYHAVRDRYGAPQAITLDCSTSGSLEQQTYVLPLVAGELDSFAILSALAAYPRVSVVLHYGTLTLTLYHDQDGFMLYTNFDRDALPSEVTLLYPDASAALAFTPMPGATTAPAEAAGLVTTDDEGLYLLWDIPFDANRNTATTLAKRNAGVTLVSQPIDSDASVQALSIDPNQSVTMFGQTVSSGELYFAINHDTERFFAGRLGYALESLREPAYYVHMFSDLYFAVRGQYGEPEMTIMGVSEAGQKEMKYYSLPYMDGEPDMTAIEPALGGYQMVEVDLIYGSMSVTLSYSEGLGSMYTNLYRYKIPLTITTPYSEAGAVPTPTQTPPDLFAPTPTLTPTMGPEIWNGIMLGMSRAEVIAATGGLPAVDVDSYISYPNCKLDGLSVTMTYLFDFDRLTSVKCYDENEYTDLSDSITSFDAVDMTMVDALGEAITLRRENWGSNEARAQYQGRAGEAIQNGQLSITSQWEHNSMLITHVLIPWLGNIRHLVEFK